MVWVGLLLLVPVLAGCTGAPADAPPASSPAARDAVCGDPYPDQRASPYVLPWARGAAHVVGQGNCTNESHATGSTDAFAYDIDMPLGTVVVAAREGMVTQVEGRFLDGNRVSGQENLVLVKHDDGTVAEYVHLTVRGPQVAVGERVRQGQDIARSGDTGESTEPHLHFQVYRCDGCGSVPVTFRNTRPHPNGLVEGEAYTAQ